MTTLGREEFHDTFAKRWAKDEHVSLLGPTGRGKSTVAREMLLRRPGRSVVLAPKGADRTLSNVGRHTRKWPPGPLFDKRPDESGKLLIRLEPPLKKVEDFGAMREHFRKCLADCYRQENWTLYLDELQVLGDPRMMGLGGIISHIMVTGRSKGVTVMGSAQKGTNIPRSTYDQASHVILFQQRDKEALKRVSEISGVDTRLVQDTLMDLDFHEFLWIDAPKDKLYRVSAS